MPSAQHRLVGADRGHPKPEGGGDGIRIVVQNGEYWLRNNGDLAMLDVIVGRIRARWPHATIDVVTSAPSLLSAYLPGVRPVSDGRFSGVVAPFWKLASTLGPGVVGPVSVRWLHLRKELSERLAPVRAKLRRGSEGGLAAEDGPATPDTPAVAPRVAAAVHGASLVLAIGGGYVTDVDPDQATRTFDVLEAAIEEGIPTAMVGQGLGPLTDPALTARAAKVLPQVGLIALREGRAGPELLRGLGVPDERVVVTGDDAIELAHGVHRDRLGAGIGICLRVAEYSPVGAQAMAAVGAGVRAVAAQESAPLVPLIISEYRSEDRRSTLPLVEGAEHVVPPLGPFVSAREVARRVSRCRVVVTGAYHLAVFALSQGIPVVGLTSSQYYDDKFLGLTEMFGGGLELVHLDGPDLEGTLTAAVRAAWASAPEVRDSLRSRAVEQITASRNALATVFGTVRPATSTAFSGADAV